MPLPTEVGVGLFEIWISRRWKITCPTLDVAQTCWDALKAKGYDLSSQRP